MKAFVYINDPLVEGVRRIRREHAAQFGNDLKKIVEDLRKQEQESVHVRVSPGPKRLIPTIIGGL